MAGIQAWVEEFLLVAKHHFIKYFCILWPKTKRLQQYGIIILTIPYRQAPANIDRKHSTKILLCSSEKEHSTSILRLGRELLVEGSGPFFNMRISQGSYWVRNLANDACTSLFFKPIHEPILRERDTVVTVSHKILPLNS